MGTESGKTVCGKCILRRVLHMKIKVLVAQLCSTLCNPVGYSPLESSVHGIFQARMLGWVAISFCRGSS